MSTCTDCGAEVNFIPVGKNERGKLIWSRPLEPVEKYAREYGVSRDDKHVYLDIRVHDCPKREEAQSMWARAEPIADLWARAMVRGCPKCDVGPGEKCLNLRDRESERSRPHEERIKR